MKTLHGGFTLIEVLVAIAISAVLSVLAYGGLDNILRSQQHLHGHISELQALEVLFETLEQDLEQAVPRPIRDRLGETLPGLQAVPDQQVMLSLTVARRNQAQLTQGRGLLQRVDYRLQQGRLYRDVWPVLDRAHDSRPVAALLIDKVEDLRWRYLGQSWQNYWPQDSAGFSQLPAAIELSISLPDARTYQRLFVLSGI